MGTILSCCRSGSTLSVIIVAIAIGFGSHSVAQNSDLGSGTDSSASATWPGNERLNFQADLFTGRFAYSVPIVVAPARQGAEPALALSYNSAGGNGWCGVGWSLEAGFIQRESRHGVPVKWGATAPLHEYDDAKGFVFNVGGASPTFATGRGQSRKCLRTRIRLKKVCTKNQSLSSWPFCVIRGGDWGGSSQLNWLKSILWSFSG